MNRTVTKQYATVAIPVGLWNQIRRVLEATGAYTNEAEFVREAVREKLKQVSIVEPKDMSEEQVREKVIDYIRKNAQAYASDITMELGIPYFTVVETIEKLVRDGVLEPAREAV